MKNTRHQGGDFLIFVVVNFGKMVYNVKDIEYITEILRGF